MTPGSKNGGSAPDVVNSAEENPDVPPVSGSDRDIERRLKVFEEQERRRLELPVKNIEQWRDRSDPRFLAAERESTTILLGGLTVAQDVMIQAALEGIGYTIETLPCPDNDAMHLGKEFGNRGQCNPTYFTVGSLLQKLTGLRDAGMPVEEIIRRYVFLTAGACGPCRFGTYATEYRKALRDSGFDGFRVLLFQQQGGLKQAAGFGTGMSFSPRFFLQIIRALIAGDLLNAMAYRIRPYEVHPGRTDEVLERCKAITCEALRHRSSLFLALRRCRSELNGIEVDRLQAKPRVMIIGEFWAMTTEGAGNYHLQRFLESEGAEVDVQFVTSWLLYMLWQNRYDARRRMTLRHADDRSKGLSGRYARLVLLRLSIAEQLLRLMFRAMARAIGLEHCHLPDMDLMALQAGEFYDVELRGGEGHMEVGKVIDSVAGRKSHMIISVKPFGCMPSSGVSDGIQSAVIARHPEAVFCPVETTGDGDVNFQSRVLMHLFKARRQANDEFGEALHRRGLTLEEARQRLTRRQREGTYYPPHQSAGLGANLIAVIP
ncbi:MAG: hypothetical protein KA152_12645 [Verrucomicrobiales bacterium]|nr:hypothetical protein [Verrucomicrobiales bacterium]